MVDGPTILYLNQKTIKNDCVRLMLADGFDWTLLDTRNRFEYGINAWYVRKGQNFMPFQNQIAYLDHFRMPDFDHRFDLDFDQTSDQICHDLLHTRSDRPWIIQWSGGIDSTVIVAAVLKNLSKSDRNNVTISCNHASVMEYPKFYMDCIQPHFRVIDSATICSADVADQYYLINGEPGDQIFGHRYSRFLGELGQLNWKHQPDQLIGYLTGFSDPVFARWVYEGMQTNLESLDMPVSTYRDWFWWLSFNLAWAGVLLRQHIGFENAMSMSQYLESVVHWYKYPAYQQWSMHNNHARYKGGSTPGDDKIAAKQYINSVYPDSYYLSYKTKIDSTGRLGHRSKLDWVAMLDDFTVLKFPQDSALLRDLVHLHCR